jgi:heme/copper-type cytochrome/quinol oxidase subunit 1
MGITYYILPLLKREIYSKKLAKVQPYFYGIGQTLFVLGMFWAGSHQVQRKTYGADQVLSSIPEYAGMAIMGFGGLIAIVGGAFFVLNALFSLMKEKKEIMVSDLYRLKPGSSTMHHELGTRSHFKTER